MDGPSTLAGQGAPVRIAGNQRFSLHASAAPAAHREDGGWTADFRESDPEHVGAGPGLLCRGQRFVWQSSAAVWHVPCALCWSSVQPHPWSMVHGPWWSSGPSNSTTPTQRPVLTPSESLNKQHTAADYNHEDLEVTCSPGIYWIAGSRTQQSRNSKQEIANVDI